MGVFSYSMVGIMCTGQHARRASEKNRIDGETEQTTLFLHARSDLRHAPGSTGSFKKQHLGALFIAKSEPVGVGQREEYDLCFGRDDDKAQLEV